MGTRTAHLDYGVQFWSSYYRMDIRLLESVQRRMTNMIAGMDYITYENRLLKRLNLHLLERCRVREDLIEAVFKWFRRINKGNINKNSYGKQIR